MICDGSAQSTRISECCGASASQKRYRSCGQVQRRGYRRGSTVEPYATYLRQRLAEGCANQSQLWREINEQGFTGTRSLVAKWIRAQRTDDEHPTPRPRRRLPSPKPLAWLVLRADDPERSPADRALWDGLCRHPELRPLQRLVNQFATMVRERHGAQLADWLTDCCDGAIPEFRTFAKTLEIDLDAVTAVLTLPWSNGPVEGQITKLKLLKRGAYGRMKLDVLRQRLLHAAEYTRSWRGQDAGVPAKRRGRPTLADGDVDNPAFHVGCGRAPVM